MKLLKKIFLVSLIACVSFFITRCSGVDDRTGRSDSDTGSIEILKPVIPFSPKHYVCYKTPEPITVDGKITEGNWEKAPWTDYLFL